MTPVALSESQPAIAAIELKARTRVLVVDDHAIIREGVCLMLQQEPDIQLIGSVGTGEDAVSFVRRNKPDLVVMDLGLPGMSGLDATRIIIAEQPDVRILILTMYTDEQYLLGMMDIGVSGYLSKQSAVNDLVPAIRAIANGCMFMHPSATKSLVELMRRGRERAAGVDTLTEREKDVLRFVAQGCSSKDIARKLCLSSRTVDNYRSRIMEKLQARNAFDAVTIAIKQGMIEPLT